MTEAMPYRNSRHSHLAVALVVLAVDMTLSWRSVGASYAVRAAIALAIWLVGLRLVPLRSLEEYPMWGRFHSSLKCFVVVAGAVAALVVLSCLVSWFVCGRGLFWGVRPPFVVASPDAVLGYALFGGLAAPVVEEFVYRGVLHPRLRAAVGSAATVALAGPIFWGLHWVYYQGVTSPHHLVVGWLLAAVYERTRSLLAPTLLHSAGNLSLLALDCVAFRHPELFSAL